MGLKESGQIGGIKVHPFNPNTVWLAALGSPFGPNDERGVFRSIVDLQAAINRYIAEHNDDPKPFIWTKTANAILAKTTRLPVPSV